MTNEAIGTGMLFRSDAHTRFLDATRQKYESMKSRLKSKGYEGVPFSLDEFRQDVLGVMGGKEDGVLQCRYCTGIFPIEEIAADHATPLGRGGGPELENIDYPCAACNRTKENLTPIEFQKLIKFLDTEIPTAKTNILARLQKSISLAIGARRNFAVINYLKNNGEWEKADLAIKTRRMEKKHGLKPF